MRFKDFLQEKSDVIEKLKKKIKEEQKKGNISQVEKISRLLKKVEKIKDEKTRRDMVGTKNWM